MRLYPSLAFLLIGCSGHLAPGISTVSRELGPCGTRMGTSETAIVLLVLSEAGDTVRTGPIRVRAAPDSASVYPPLGTYFTAGDIGSFRLGPFPAGGYRIEVAPLFFTPDTVDVAFCGSGEIHMRAVMRSDTQSHRGTADRVLAS